MSDDLDERIRAAMKTLDAEAPSGYFEALPARTLARLEDGTMHTEGTSSKTESTGVPPQEREEDSGLHDIRSLASSTKMRISKRMGSVPPPVDDDILASSSAGWKAVALPEPAKMVSLPELADLPSAKEIKERDKAARKAAKDAAKDAKRDAKAEAVAAAAPVAAAASSSASLRAPTYLDENEPIDIAAPAVAKPAFGANITKQTSGGNKTAVFVIVGLGLAAAAGGAFFLMKKDKDATPATPVAAVEPAPEPVARAAEPPAPPPPPPPVEEPVAEPPAEPEQVEAAAAVPDEPHDTKPAKGAARKGKKEHAVEIDLTAGQAEKPKKDAPDPKKPAAKKEESSDPSFDALLKEAGVESRKDKGPTLDKKSLSSTDIKNGMGAVAGKAKACYAGEQGTAAVKLTVSPSGEVQKVTVTGQFKGTPVAACVEAAVRSASFPPWDGGPQSFNFSYLLSE